MCSQVQADADMLRKAMKGFGTDNETLISIITSRTNEELQVLRQVYQQEKHRDLVEDVKSETSGNYEMALVGTLLSRAEWDAKCLRACMKGVGTDERGLIQILVHRTAQEIKAIEEVYMHKYGHTLTTDIINETSGLTSKFFLGLLMSDRTDLEVIDPIELAQDINALYFSGQGRLGTDEDTFVNIITKHGNNYLRALNLAYGRQHGDTLIKAVKKEMSGWLSEGLRDMICDHDTYYANLLHKAMDGVGTDETLLVRVVTSRRHRLRQINDAFMTLYDKNLYHRVESEVSGNLKAVLLGISKGC